MWADIERIIIDEHQQHRSRDKVARHVHKHLRRHFAGLRANAITYDKLLLFKHARLDEGASPSTVRYELSLVRTGLVVAHKAGRLAALSPIPHVHVENTRTSFIDDDEYLALVGELKSAKRVHRSVAAAVGFEFWTGWRKNEVLTREWRHVDFERGTVSIDAGELAIKNYEGRPFPFAVLPGLAAMLRNQREYTNEVEPRTGQIVRWVFHREGGQVKSFRAAWKAACRRAGLVGKIPHDFRRSAVRRLDGAGVARSVPMKLVGHKTEAIYRRYAITNEADLREGLAKVANAVAARPARVGRAQGPLKAQTGPHPSTRMRTRMGLVSGGAGN